LVVVTVDVLTDGTVGDATVKGGDQRLADDALRAAKQCRFQPGTFSGKPTSMNFDVKYQF
jgi:TonB family protein